MPLVATTSAMWSVSYQCMNTSSDMMGSVMRDCTNSRPGPEMSPVFIVLQLRAEQRG